MIGGAGSGGGRRLPERPLQPGATIGVIGGGQLGRMLILEARRMGYRTCVLDPDGAGPGGQVADERVVAPYDSADGICELMRRVDVATYEFEHIDAAAVEAGEAIAPLRPGSRLLRIAQHRVVEKETLARHGFPVAPFRAVESWEDLERGLAAVGLPAVLKTATAGYDGKGQRVLRDAAEARRAYEELRAASPALVVERLIPFAKELSVICARSLDGASACFPAVENRHVSGILDVTLAPAPVSRAVAERAARLASAIAERLDVVGLLTVELFLTEADELLVNELAPRPHNSGHYTLDACATSQFEQLLRTLCRLPLGETRLLSPAAMVNLLGDLWEAAGGRPDFAAALEEPGVRLHLYGKAEPRRGRKMGHLTAVAPTLEEALARAERARARLVPARGPAPG